MINNRNAPLFRILTSYTLIFLTSLASVRLVSSASDFMDEPKTASQPASEGRVITPAGTLVLDSTTRQPAVGALPVDFVRSPDHNGPDGQGRYLVVVNSGFGIQFSSSTNGSQQSLAVIDLKAQPQPVVIQNVYFPSPQSVNVGVVFSPQPEGDGSYSLYASGGVENKIWIFRFRPDSAAPISPASPGPISKVEAPFIDINGFANAAPSPRYNNDLAAIYPMGLAISPDGNSLYVANNLGDTLGIIADIRGARNLIKVDLHHGNNAEFIYPYGVVALPDRNHVQTEKIYVSCWNDASVAVIDLKTPRSNDYRPKFITVDRHPTAMILNQSGNRLLVVNSNADSVSVIDTATDREIERINVKLAETALVGSSPESLALNAEGDTLYVANSHSNAVAVVALSANARGTGPQQAVGEKDDDDRDAQADRRGGPKEDLAKQAASHSALRGFIPTGQYPSAVAWVNHALFVGNGKGTGFENSSTVVNNSGRVPNAPNDRFPTGAGRGGGRGGQYSVSLVAGNISTLAEPDERTLAGFTQQVMRNDGLIGQANVRLFNGASPIKHIIYVIKENRTYDQVFGDLAKSGDGKAADGDARLAIFGHSEIARSPGGAAQNISPNHQALASRFGLFDRFFVNSEASPDGHNWATAAFSSDYVDKGYRWNYSRRGRTYDFEGFNRLPNYGPSRTLPPMFRTPVDVTDVEKFMRQYVPYLNGSMDVAEPATLYLWDAAAKAGLTYRNYGEFVSTLSEADVASINRDKPYPDLSPTISAFPTKKSLEGHFSATYRNFDLHTPDAMTPESYRAAKESNGQTDPLISQANAGEKFHGASRLGDWLGEFQGYVDDLKAGRTDRMPNLSILRISNDHTSGLAPGQPTPQFFVADNDYAIGRLVEAVSNSPYWKDTAIFMVEDDAQDGPDHVDAHRSVALVVSAYNRPGALIHDFHNTVSLIRTMEILLGMAPMNQLDASAVPMDIFRAQPDMRPYKATLPEVAINNLMTPNAPNARDAALAYWVRRTAEQDFTRSDLADAGVLNNVIWYSVTRGKSPRPETARLPAYDLMKVGLKEEDEGKAVAKR